MSGFHSHWVRSVAIQPPHTGHAAQRPRVRALCAAVPARPPRGDQSGTAHQGTHRTNDRGRCKEKIGAAARMTGERASKTATNGRGKCPGPRAARGNTRAWSADPGNPATQAYRARIRARFAELHDEREHLEAQLKTLAKTTPAAADTSLLDQLPLAGDILPGLPPSSKPAYSPPSTPPSCGTSPAARPPSTPRSPNPPCTSSPASWTPPRTDTTTPTMTSPNL